MATHTRLSVSRKWIAASWFHGWLVVRCWGASEADTTGKQKWPRALVLSTFFAVMTWLGGTRHRGVSQLQLIFGIRAVTLPWSATFDLDLQSHAQNGSDQNNGSQHGNVFQGRRHENSANDVACHQALSQCRRTAGIAGRPSPACLGSSRQAGRQRLAACRTFPLNLA